MFLSDATPVVDEPANGSKTISFSSQPILTNHSANSTLKGAGCKMPGFVSDAAITTLCGNEPLEFNSLICESYTPSLELIVVTGFSKRFLVTSECSVLQLSALNFGLLELEKWNTYSYLSIALYLQFVGMAFFLNHI